MEEKKVLVLLTDTYKPQICSATSLMSELAEKLVGFNVKTIVLTPFPDNRVSSELETSALKKHEIINGVEVVRIKVPAVNRKNYILRGLSTIAASKSFRKKCNSVLKNIHVDAFLCYSPPLNFVDAGLKLAKSKRSLAITLLRDLFPDNAIDLGILKNKLAIKYYLSVEKSVYKNSDFILPQSISNKRFLINNKNISEKKLKVVYNWSNVDKYEKKSFLNYKEKWNLTDSLVVLYAGTMGPAQSLEEILYIAENTKNKNIKFLFVGNGVEKEKLIKYSNDKKLTNVIFKDYIEQEKYPDLVRSCDIGIISLSKKNHTDIVPGKLVGYLAGKLPIFANVNKESVDLQEILNQSKSGVFNTSENKSEMLSKFNKLIEFSEERRVMGIKGNQYLKEHFEVSKVAEDILKLINER